MGICYNSPNNKERGCNMSGAFKHTVRAVPGESISLTLTNSGQQKCEPSQRWGKGVREQFIHHFIDSGKGTYITPEGSLSLSAGDVFLNRPLTEIEYFADNDDPWEYYWVGFNGACANKLVQQTPFSDVQPVHHCKDPQSTRETIYNIYLARGPEPQCEALMTGYLYLFMAQLMKEAREAMPNAPSSSSQYVLAAIKYIQFNYSHDISVDDIAKAVGVSRSHLYRVFMSNVGQSPIDYLTGYRISEACSLLKNTGLSIAEIAVSVGFFDQFYFSRVFKKVKGVPPSKYLAALEKDPQLGLV